MITNAWIHEHECGMHVCSYVCLCLYECSSCSVWNTSCMHAYVQWLHCVYVFMIVCYLKSSPQQSPSWSPGEQYPKCLFDYMFAPCLRDVFTPLACVHPSMISPYPLYVMFVIAGRNAFALHAPSLPLRITPALNVRTYIFISPDCLRCRVQLLSFAHWR